MNVILPRDVQLLLVAVLVTGIAAAFTTQSLLLALTTPVLAWAIVRSARSSARPGNEASYVIPLPAQLQHTVDRALVHLADASDAERLLGDVIRQARPLFADHDTAFDAHHEALTRANAVELVTECCDVALQLGQVDELRSMEILAAQDATDRTATREKFDASRTMLARQLADAAAALRALYIAGVDQGTPATERVAELVSEIRNDASARSAAIQEMRALH